MPKLVLIVIVSLCHLPFAHLLSPNEEEIQIINHSQKFWTAAENNISILPLNDFRRLLGSRLSKERLPEKQSKTVSNDIPSTFDARTKWPKCPSISSVKDQSNCGSCWAIATATSLSDRLCIGSNGKIQISLSAEHLLSCCSECVESHKLGCDGGFADRAYDRFQKHGLVTGGDYNSAVGCQPYQIGPNSYDTRKANVYTPPCSKKCTNKSYKTPYSKDKHYGKSAYSISQDVAKIQNEIMEYGPVTATFDVYKDFKYYTGGVYVKTSSEKLETHSVKVIGWGTENKINYWLAVNSWNVNWGDKGLFKIRRGTNECNFESHITAGLTTT